MNGFRTLVLLINVVFLVSCSEGDNSPIILDSIGAKDEVLIVADEVYLNTFLRKDTESRFMSAFDVLPQGELKLNATFLPFKHFAKNFKRYRVIYLFADLSNKSDISEFVANSLGEEKLVQALSDNDFFMVQQENAWAKPQKVFLVFAQSKQALQQLIKQKGDYLAEKALDYYVEAYGEEAFALGKNKYATDVLMKKYNINFMVPKGFELVESNDSVFWLRLPTNEGSENILGLVRQTDSIEIENKGIAYRDIIGKQYVSTQKEGTFMATDSVLNILSKPIKINSLQGYVNRGLWQMENEFMGGPFVNYYLMDFEHKREIMIDAFVYAPGDKKKPHIRRLEAIAHQLKAN